MNSKFFCFKKTVVEAFVEHCNTGHYTLNFHLLDNVIENLRRFETLGVLNAPPSESYVVHIEKPYHKTSRRMKAKT